MTTRNHTTSFRCLLALLCCVVQAVGMVVIAQDVPRAALKREHRLQQADTVSVPVARVSMGDSLLALGGDSLRIGLLRRSEADSLSVADSIGAENKRRMMELTASPDLHGGVATDTLPQAADVKRWIPDPAKATWMALVIPGGGQIYNRKFWKLPIFYGGFAGCAYALTWNGNMYRDYSNAYRDAVNGNWNSSSITDLLPPGYTGSISHSQLTETLRRRKDMYRRYRDLSIFAFIGVYLLSVVDAYVDAELSNFDIGPDLSMKVEPAVIDGNTRRGSAVSLNSERAVGVQCSFRF